MRQSKLQPQISWCTQLESVLSPFLSYNTSDFKLGSVILWDGNALPSKVFLALYNFGTQNVQLSQFDIQLSSWLEALQNMP